MYKCIAIDPPWKESGGGKSKRGADRHYPLMSVPQIIETILQAPIWKPEPNSHLWLWSTNRFLVKALHVMEALGYRYVTNAAWAKAKPIGPPAAPPHGQEGSCLWQPQHGGLGQYLRGAHELLLFGVRGRLAGQSKSTRSLMLAPRTKHSEKPPQGYQLIEQVSPGPRAELFARRPRAGWDCWGAIGDDPPGFLCRFAEEKQS